MKKFLLFNKITFYIFLFFFSLQFNAQEKEFKSHQASINQYVDEMKSLVDSLGFIEVRQNLINEVEFFLSPDELTQDQYYKQLALLKVMLKEDENSFILSEYLLYQTYSDYLKGLQDKNSELKKLGQISTSSDSFLFFKLELSPTAKKCSKEKNNFTRRSCLQEELKNYISANFDTHKASKKLEKNGRINSDNEDGIIARIYVTFVIDTKGKVVDVKGFSEYPELIKQCEQLIKKAPQLVPGKSNGEKVRVSYNIPIVFQVN